MIAGDGDAVELRHLARRVAENVADDPHRGFGRVDIGVADHELLEDVVLARPVERHPVYPLLLARDDEEGEYRNRRPVPRHTDQHLVERDAVAQYHQDLKNTRLTYSP